MHLNKHFDPLTAAVKLLGGKTMLVTARTSDIGDSLENTAFVR